MQPDKSQTETHDGVSSVAGTSAAGAGGVDGQGGGSASTSLFVRWDLKYAINYIKKWHINENQVIR